MRKDDELGMIVFDPKVIEILGAYLGDDLKAAKEIDCLRWKKEEMEKRLWNRLLVYWKKKYKNDVWPNKLLIR